MQLKKGDLIPVIIHKLAFGGAGLGECQISQELAEQKPWLKSISGIKIFVPDTIPGDQLLVSLTKIKSNRLEGKIHSFTKLSALRIEPRCQHFPVCGGCVWQNIEYKNQLSYKQQQVQEALAHLGNFPESELLRIIKPIILCNSPFEYRNKMEFSFGRSQEGKVMLGLHSPGMRHEVFDLKECFLPSGIFANLVEVVRDFAKKEKLEVYDDRTQDGLLKNLIIREGKNTGQIMVNLVTSANSFPAINRFKELFKIGIWKDKIHSLLWTTVMQSRGVPTWRESQVLVGKATIHEQLKLENGHKLDFEISAQSFFQPNTHQAEILYAQVVKLAGLTGKEVVYDLYCGTGTIGLFCAHAAKKVYGIESVKEAIENAKRNQISNAEFIIEDVGKWLGDNQSNPQSIAPDVVVMDPPRAGLNPDIPQKIAHLKVPKIVYVSCNPATLARDLRLFYDLGYFPEIVQPVDMFPHTYHVETVVQLKKTKKDS